MNEQLTYWFSDEQAKSKAESIREALRKAGHPIVKRHFPGFTTAVALGEDVTQDTLLRYSMTSPAEHPHGTNFSDMTMRGRFNPVDVVDVISEFGGLAAISYEKGEGERFLAVLWRARNVCIRNKLPTPLVMIEPGTRDTAMNKRIENRGFNLIESLEA